MTPSITSSLTDPYACIECPLHTVYNTIDTIVSNANGTMDDRCEICPIGTISNTEHTTCVDCFKDSQNQDQNQNQDHPTCPPGYIRETSLPVIMDFYNISDPQNVFHHSSEHALSESTQHGLLRHWCALEYACLPCLPGTYQGTYQSNAQCLSCDHGQYQPNIGATQCFHCDRENNTLSTLARGSTSREQCLCIEGFE